MSKEYTREGKKMIMSSQVQEISRRMAADGYHRTAFTSNLVQSFIEGVEVVPHPKFPALHRARLHIDAFIAVEVLKNITYAAIIRSPVMQTVEYRGKDIVGRIFGAIVEEGGSRLLPDDFQKLFAKGDEVHRYRTACDFIAGMTDRYALEFYSRLFGEKGLTVHKPL